MKQTIALVDDDRNILTSVAMTLEAEGFVVHHRIGLTNPGQVGTDAQRFFELTGNRLILKPPLATADGQQVQGYITWERVTPATGSR